VLAAYTGETELREMAVGALVASGALMQRYASMVGHHLSVFHSLGRGRELAVLGLEPRSMTDVFWERFRPHIVFATAPRADDRIPLLAGRGEPGATLAYVCENHVCNLPTSDAEAVRAQLSA
jgi:uncharacterized protein YyaL (SSP411 family)